MQDPRNNPVILLLLLVSAALALLAACSGDDDEDPNGIELSQADDDSGDDDETPSATATGTQVATVINGTTAGTVVIPGEIDLVEDFEELKTQIEEDLDPSPLDDEDGLDELVADCADEDPPGAPTPTATATEDSTLTPEQQRQAQLDSCVELIDLLVSEDVDELQPLIDLVTEFALAEFPEDSDEIEEAAGITPTPTATSN
ncbi:MAG: hypothetical protein WEB00_03855 [Dehalococcoidia bacterium]